MLTLDSDRRTDARVSLTRPCKVFEPRSRKYLPGSTCNVSAGGMLMRLDRRLEVEPGDRLYVAVAPKRRSELLRADEMIEARVVWALSLTTGATTVAVRFADPAQLVGLPVQRAA